MLLPLSDALKYMKWPGIAKKLSRPEHAVAQRCLGLLWSYGNQLHNCKPMVRRHEDSMQPTHRTCIYTGQRSSCHSTIALGDTTLSSSRQKARWHYEGDTRITRPDETDGVSCSRVHQWQVLAFLHLRRGVMAALNRTFVGATVGKWYKKWKYKKWKISEATSPYAAAIAGWHGRNLDDMQRAIEKARTQIESRLKGAQAQLADALDAATRDSKQHQRQAQYGEREARRSGRGIQCGHKKLAKPNQRQAGSRLKATWEKQCRKVKQKSEPGSSISPLRMIEANLL